jgi:hypothetical protein
MNVPCRLCLENDTANADGRIPYETGGFAKVGRGKSSLSILGNANVVFAPVLSRRQFDASFKTSMAAIARSPLRAIAARGVAVDGFGRRRDHGAIRVTPCAPLPGDRSVCPPTRARRLPRRGPGSR